MSGTRLDDRRSDAKTPICVLIEAHHLPGERHAEGHEQQEDADNPGELARKFIRPEEKDLRHVDQHDRDHEIRSPAVHRAQEPAQRQVVIAAR